MGELVLLAMLGAGLGSMWFLYTKMTDGRYPEPSELTKRHWADLKAQREKAERDGTG